MAINMTFTDFVTPVPADWLNNVNFVVNNPTGVSYLAPYTSSISRTLSSKLSDMISVLDFGADPTGTLDSTTAMQAAHNTGKLVRYPAGTYRYSQISISAGGIVGDGATITALISTDTTSGDTIALPWTDIYPPSTAYLFRDFQHTSSISKTTGNVMNVLSATHENSGSLFDNVQFFNGPTNVCFTTASQWGVRNCQFSSYTVAGIIVDNQDVSDAGDSCISGCLFSTSTNTAEAIIQRSSGGLKIVNSKLNGGGYGYVMAWTGTASSDLMITNCSIENMATAAMSFSRTSGSGTFSNITITNVQTAINANGIVFSDVAGFINNVVIDGVTVALIPGSGIALSMNATSLFKIGSFSITGTGGSPTGFAFASGCSNGKYDFPVTAGLTQVISNSSTTVFQSNGQQGGSASVTTSTSYGTLFLGTATVTYPTAYKTIPLVKCYPVNTTGLGVSGFPSGVSTTGFTMNIIGAQNGGAVSAQWDAQGLI